MGTEVKTALHHWWPRALSQFWVDHGGGVTSLNPDGTERRATPDQFGAITNGHAVKLDGPWSFSFESAFDKIDARITSLVPELLALEAPQRESDLRKRTFSSCEITDGVLKDIGSLMASIVTRCPRNRSVISKTTEYYQGKFGFQDPRADKNLINLNLRSSIAFINAHFTSGKYVVLISDKKEFIFGDGFYTNMATESSVGHMKTFMPITPVLAIIFSKPTQYFTYPKAMTCRLGGSYVDLFNELTQVYSGKNIFFRSQRPVITDGFSKADFLQFRYHKVPWLDDFLDDVHAVRGSIAI